MNKLTLTVPLCLMTGCAGLPFFRESKPRLTEQEAAHLVCGPAEPARAELLMQGVQYDGYTLSGRLLIGAVSGRLCLDKRLITNVSVNVNSVRDCTTGLPVTFIHADSFPRPPREEDLVVLPPGYWYGRQVNLRLFSPIMEIRGPDCIDVGLSVSPARDGSLGQLSVRAVLPANPASPVDAPKDAPSSSEPGSVP